MIRKVIPLMLLVVLFLAVAACSAGQADTPETEDAAVSEDMSDMEEVVEEAPEAEDVQESEVDEDSALAAEIAKIEEEAGTKNFVPDFQGALERTSGKKFEGVTVVLFGASGQVDGLLPAARAWEAATGATVDVNDYPFAEVPEKMITALSTGIFIGDILNVPPYFAGDLMGGGLIEPVPDASKAVLDWDDVMAVYRENQLEWDGVTYGYPWDGDVHSLYYRTDLYQDADLQAQFEDTYGYALDVPKNWAEFADQSEFFTGEWADGKQHYGATMLLMRKNHGSEGFLSVAAGFNKMPDDPAFYFDPDTMEPRINNPGFVKSLEYLQDLLPYMPPDQLNLDWFGNLQAFVSGLTALDIQWADVGPMSYDETISIIGGSVGYALTPGSNEVWDARTNEWVEFPETNIAPYAAFGGWMNMIPANAQEKEAAMDLAIFLSSPEVLQYVSVTPGSGVNPARTSTFENEEAWLNVGFSGAEEIEAFIASQVESAEHPNAVYPLRIPGYLQYKDALELAISKALAGQMTAQEALDEAAAEWEVITDSLGREAQREAYLSSIGIDS